MFKVFAFLKRNARLTHDEYRAAHVGYHCGISRRLRGIRGYTVNIWANAPLVPRLGSLAGDVVRAEPPGFLDLWDGFPSVLFDSREAWVSARDAEPTRAMASGLGIDPDWTYGHGMHVFDGIAGRPGEFRSHHLRMIEHIVLPVERPECKLTKLVLFFRRRPTLDEWHFQRRVLTDYAALTARLPGLYGCILNFRDADTEAAFRGYFPEQGWWNSNEGRRLRQDFCALWDGAMEMHFDSVAAFVAARRSAALHPQLCALESELFDAHWYVEVDENVIVMPNRDPAPAFYYR
ncbi:MAG: hypothetical protein H6993_13655 [Pseudomonadales bacterium]|nr:hypothetical protein [Pseudomonadales bacterium]MCP5185006.1 hypothetical protein [Pseudomonadales bacterium]